MGAKMFELIKQRIVKDLIGEIACLGATELELVGHNYISIREGKTLIHHGLNKDYKPSGYTVDSFSEDSSIIGEYSTEKGYFNNEGTKDKPIYKKINSDIEHALNHAVKTAIDKIYLISNQEECPSFRAIFNSTETAKRHSGVLVIIGAGELAKGVYNQSISNSDAASFYKQCLPTFSQHLDNYEYFGKLPSACSGYVHEESIFNSIVRHFADGNHICVLHGVSGSGKTQAAIDFVKRKSDTFANYIWISGDDWNSTSSLCSVQRSRGGSPFNVAGLFNSEKTILVIDNYTESLDEYNFEELYPGFERGGVVLVTSQIAAPKSLKYLSIPQFSADKAFEVLGECSSSPSELCLEFISRCRFSPLVLAITRKICADQGIDREGVYQEILDDPRSIPDDSGAPIVQRILSNLGESPLDALKKIANSGKNYHDIEFLRHFIGAIRCNTLQKLSILTPENTTGVFRIHDLVSIAVKERIDSSPIVRSIEDYIARKAGDMTPSVLRQIHLCSDIILEEHLQRGDRSIDWLHYSLLQLESMRYLGLHDDLRQLAISLSVDTASLKCIIDSREIYSYEIQDAGARTRYYADCASLYESLLNTGVPDEYRLELLHHMGKALRRSGKYSEALTAFNQILVLSPSLHATYGQIAHLGSQKDVDATARTSGEKAMRILLELIQTDVFSVPLRVSLSALARLRSYKDLVREINHEPDMIESLSGVLLVSALEGLDQFYEAFVSFTSMFGYSHSNICVSVAEAISEVLVVPPAKVDMTHWINACESLANSSKAARSEDREALAMILINSSLAFANAINEAQLLSAYQARAIAKVYNIAGQPGNAIAAIKKVPKEKVNLWLLYEEVKALLELSEVHPNEALGKARVCFQLATKDAKAAQIISTYHDLLATCYQKLGDRENAAIELRLAINECADIKYKADLEGRLDELASL
jgi:tetratricopeptide (TPR) repeat protein